jgi:hypothetical protein
MIVASVREMGDGVYFESGRENFREREVGKA